MSNITHIDSHPKRRDSILYPESVKRKFEALGVPEPGEAYGYSLGRRKGGVEIFMFFHGGFSLNISIQLSHYPRNFKEARLYMRDVQERFSLNLKEIVKQKHGITIYL